MRWILPLALFVIAPHGAFCATAHESFDRDPGWDAYHNRPSQPPRAVKQDFGYLPSNALGGEGSIGGSITPAGEPAYYATKIPTLSLETPFRASGLLRVPAGGGNTLVGFFNAGTLNEWRTPNTLVWRINGRGETFHAHIEYMTQKWRAGAGIIGRYDQPTDRNHPVENASGTTVHTWTLDYDPNGNSGGGTITATLGAEKAICNLSPGHKAEGASFDHFGIVNVIKSVDGPGELWLGKLVINGAPVDLTKDPKWEGFNNRREYSTDNVRPWFNFGWSGTKNAGGALAGEIGGRFFRGDCREAERLGYYGAKVAPLTLDKPLTASGKITMMRGVSDSTTLIGFFNHTESVRMNEAQANATPADFIGVAVEGPSSEGFFIYPVCRDHGPHTSIAEVRASPHILPDSAVHEFMFAYDPAGAEGRGAIKVTLGSESITLALEPGSKNKETVFDRFGFVTPWVDGNSQTIYIDDVSYTASQE